MFRALSSPLIAPPEQAIVAGLSAQIELVTLASDLAFDLNWLRNQVEDLFPDCVSLSVDQPKSR